MKYVIIKMNDVNQEIARTPALDEGAMAIIEFLLDKHCRPDSEVLAMIKAIKEN
jgi:hypothetical protein